MWGEDVADPKGGVFGVTGGSLMRFPDGYLMRRWPKRVSPA